jgi:hypothetical protein
LVFFLRHGFAMEAVRGGEEVAAREMGFHLVALVI